MITYYNQVRASGMETTEAMFHAAEQRIGSIALSACVFAAAISTRSSQAQRPLATVVVGGMLTGPIMLLNVFLALLLFLGREGIV